MKQFENATVTAIPEEEIIKNLTGEEREKWITRYQAEYLLDGLMKVEALQNQNRYSYIGGTMYGRDLERHNRL